MDLAVAGGAECPLERSIVERFIVAAVVQPATGTIWCRPFDRARNGTVLGEGAGVLILESRKHATLRGAVPHAVLRGYGTASEGHSQAAPDPSGSGVRRATRLALRGNNDPEWVKAHGTGTRLGDRAEYHGLVSVFGPRLATIPITSLKPLIGHCLGASGAVEMVATILALEHGFVPATLGTTDVDPIFSLYTVALVPLSCVNGSVLLLAESFGGRCAALLVGAS